MFQTSSPNLHNSDRTQVAVYAFQHHLVGPWHLKEDDVLKRDEKAFITSENIRYYMVAMDCG